LSGDTIGTVAVHAARTPRPGQLNMMWQEGSAEPCPNSLEWMDGPQRYRSCIIFDSGF